MAAGKRHRLKIKYAARLRRLSEYASEEGRNLKELMIMASAPPDEISLSHSHSHSPLRSAPEHLNGSSFSFPPSSLPSQNMLPHPSGSMTASISSQRRRKMSKHSINTLKRSASTPNVRESGMSVADKRRNKLGYHRTSVACGKCVRSNATAEADPVLQATAEDVRSDVCWPLMMLKIAVQIASG